MKLTLLSGAVASALLSTLFLSGCSSSSSELHNLDNMKKVLNTNADIAYATYSDSVTTAEALKVALATLEADQDAAALLAAKQAWLVSREPYGQSEVYRFRNSPIDDDPTTATAEDGPEGDLNAWPLGEALIDYVTVDTSATDDFDTDQVGVSSHSITGVNSGNAINEAQADSDPADNIIGQTTITINAALLSNTATADDEHDVIAGYHAIEFLLWGQDLNNSNDQVTDGTDRDAAVKTSTNGSRPITDFVADTTCTSGTGNITNAGSGEVCQRRHTYLEVAVDKMIADLEAVRDQWAPGVSGNYRDTFTGITTIAEGKTRLLEILTGMGTLSEGELAGERMQIALSANSQEDEHSCFSDNTHRDIWLDAEGVANSYNGTYAGYDSTLNGVDNETGSAVDGYGLDEYLADIGKTDLAADVAAALSTTETNYIAVDAKARDDGMPFDVLIMDPTGSDTASVRDTIVSLNAQSTQIAKIATELDLGSADDVVDPDGSACDTTNPTTACP